MDFVHFAIECGNRDVVDLPLEHVFLDEVVKVGVVALVHQSVVELELLGRDVRADDYGHGRVEKSEVVGLEEEYVGEAPEKWSDDIQEK